MVSGFVMAAILPAMMTLWRMQKFSVSMPGVQADAQGMALRMADALRGATLCTSTDTGCTLDAPAENATATGITVYRRNDNGTLSEQTYSVVSGEFRLVKGGVTTTFCRDAAMTLTFYGSATYNSSSLSTFSPTNATLKTLTAVGIATTVTRDGLTGSYSTLIRLRNSPKPQ